MIGWHFFHLRYLKRLPIWFETVIELTDVYTATLVKKPVGTATLESAFQ